MTGLPRLTVAAALAVLLTSLSLQPTMQDGRWIVATVLCVALVAVVGYAARRARVPRLLVPVLEVTALGVWLVVRFGHDVAIWGVLPGRDVGLRGRDLLNEATSTISASAPPAPVNPGMVFLIAMSVALVAVVVDTVGVTFRSPALAGLPLLVLYAVPVSVIANGVSWIYFGLAAGGWLFLLLADGRERLGGWGRRLGTRTFAGDPTASDVPVAPEPLGAVGRRIALLSVALAIVVPALVPGLSEAVFGHGSGGGTGGGGTVNTINPFVSLGSDLNRPHDTTVLTYESNAVAPDYLRVVSLDTFDGKTWLPASLKTSGRVQNGGMPDPPGLASTTPRTEVSTSIHMEELTQSTWLPVPYPVTSVTVEGDTAHDWVWDTANRVIWSAQGDTEDLRYTVTSLAVQPTATQLADAPSMDPAFVATFTDYPHDAISPLVVDTAKAVTAQATTPYAKAVALQSYFTDKGTFVYDSTAAYDSDDPLTAFLTNKRGFCQHFAGTFAVMARIVGLPTRVVVGFVPGDKTGPNSWAVTWHDTHAWPEVYFEGVGWTRFEPTPRSDNAGVTRPAWTVVTQDPGSEDPGTSSPSPTTGQVPSGSASNPLHGPGEERGLSAVPGAGHSFPWIWVLVPLAVVGVLLVPWAVRLWQRRRRLVRADDPDPKVAAAAAWAELAATCADLDLAWPASRTPRQVAVELIRSAHLEGLPSEDALRRLAMATERARYAPAPMQVSGLAADVRAGRAGLLTARNRRQRWQAALVPVSLLSRAGARTADALDWVDAAPRRVRGAVRVARPRRPRAKAGSNAGRSR